ncbi:Calcipressin-domain-containing protein [Dipodascopsis uninucleata]
MPTSNTLVITGLSSDKDFEKEKLDAVYNEIDTATSEGNADNQSAIVHWAPLKSFGRIVVVMKTVEDALIVKYHFRGSTSIRKLFSGRLKVYFGENTPAECVETLMNKSKSRDSMHLQLPDAGKLFLISPPPSPPMEWESGYEEPPNTETGVLPELLARALMQVDDIDENQMSVSSSEESASRSNSFGLNRTSTSSSLSHHTPSVVVIKPDEGEGNPGIIISDYSDESTAEYFSAPSSDFTTESFKARASLSRTSRPPMEY